MIHPIYQQPFNWFEALPREATQAIQNKLIAKTYQAGEFLYHQGDVLSSIAQIESGEVEICNFSEDGEQFILGLLNKGGWCGEISITLNQPVAYSCIARTTVEVNVLARENWLKLLEQHPIISSKVLIKSSQLLRLFMDRATVASRATVRDRLIWLLLWLKDSSSQASQNELCLIENLKMSDLYRMLGTARQTLSREFKALAEEGLIEQRAEGIIIFDAEALEKASKQTQDFFSN